MKFNKNGSYTAKLIAAVFYVFLRKSKFPNASFQRFVLTHLKRKSFHFWILNLLIQWKLDFVFKILEEIGLPGFFNHVGARKKIIFSTVEDFTKQGIRQVVVLGGGYDFLGTWLAKTYPKLEVFEVDHPKTQAQKKKMIGPSSANLRYVSCDFSNDSFVERILEQEWNFGESTIFVWEGVTMYLESDDIKKTLNQIHEIQCTTGAQYYLIFTFMNKRPDGDIQFFRASRGINKLLKLGGEPFTWGLEKEKMDMFLANHSFKLQKMWSSNEVSDLIPDSETIVLCKVLKSNL